MSDRDLHPMSELDAATTELPAELAPPAPSDASAAEPGDAAEAVDAGEAVVPLRARTRWAGIVWGLVFVGLAAAGVWLSSAEGRADELAAWIQRLDTATAIGYGLLAVGALVLVTGLVGLLRRAQRAVAARR
ncbi:hypothetical protein N3K63_01385 [Microbacterium sp. W1N]|uniref:hypothetical protein n=1 Tax=Microbacterium festucae TaxID=2977531 RepID=UPI0021C22AAE|nr:hypothetical protein [Microbacterium festucae]MCT9818932.1 hypothetical protein [Microbacterium festucae]